MIATITECPECGRIVDTPTDEEERKADKHKIKVADEKCLRCQEGAEDREARL